MKSAARRAALSRRRALPDDARAAAAAAHLLAVLAAHAGKVIAGYMPIRTEISPLPAMAGIADRSPVCVPVIQGEGLPLLFREWHPGAAMIDGPFGALVPASGAFLEPRVLIVPLLAFDRRGFRLGYGGGFYDRTLALLRGAGPVTAIGLAFAGQEVPEVPTESTDQPLDLIVTEEGSITPRR